MRKHKYRAVPIVVDGERFDSTGEHLRWRDLKLLERAGEIKRLRRQVRIGLWAVSGTTAETSTVVPLAYESGRQAVYVADFVYEEQGDEVIEDFKGMDTPLSKLKRAIVEAMYGTRVRVTRK